MEFTAAVDNSNLRKAVVTRELPDSVKLIEKNLNRAALNQMEALVWEEYSTVSDTTQKKIKELLKKAGYKCSVMRGEVPMLRIKF